MLEKEKMLAGELYNANYDKDLIKERYFVKDKCYNFNQLKPSNYEEKVKLYEDIEKVKKLNEINAELFA